MPRHCTTREDLDDDHATAAAWTSGLAGIDIGTGRLAVRFCNGEQLTRMCDVVSARAAGEQAIVADAVVAAITGAAVAITVTAAAKSMLRRRAVSMLRRRRRRAASMLHRLHRRAVSMVTAMAAVTAAVTAAWWRLWLPLLVCGSKADCHRNQFPGPKGQHQRGRLSPGCD